MKIIIPTTGRAGRVKTLESLGPFAKDAILIGGVNDYDAYHGAYPFNNIHICSQHGIRAKRQWIIDNYNHYGKIAMMDDDLTFYTRETDKKFVKSNTNQVGQMLDCIANMLDDYAQVGITDKFMSQQKPRGYVVGSRYNHVLAYNFALFPVQTPRFRVECNEEHDFHLQLRQYGLKPCVITEYSKTDKAYAPGGCSSWRTAETELNAHNEFAKLWPNAVKVVPSKNSISKYVTRINWRKFDDEYTLVHPIEVKSKSA